MTSPTRPGEHFFHYHARGLPQAGSAGSEDPALRKVKMPDQPDQSTPPHLPDRAHPRPTCAPSSHQPYRVVGYAIPAAPGMSRVSPRRSRTPHRRPGTRSIVFALVAVRTLVGRGEKRHVGLRFGLHRFGNSPRPPDQLRDVRGNRARSWPRPWRRRSRLCARWV